MSGSANMIFESSDGLKKWLESLVVMKKADYETASDILYREKFDSTSAFKYITFDDLKGGLGAPLASKVMSGVEPWQKWLKQQQQPMPHQDAATPPAQKKAKSEQVSPGWRGVDEAAKGDGDLLPALLKVCSDNHFAAMETKIPKSPFRKPKLGAFVKENLGHSGDDIDMRFSTESSLSPVGSKLCKHLLEHRNPKDVVLLGKSGAGKTTAIFDAARQASWCVLFTASSHEEREGIGRKGDPGGFDYSFATLVNDLTHVLNDASTRDHEKNSKCDLLIMSLVVARIVVMLHFKELEGASKEAWLVYQLSREVHAQIKKVYSRLKKHPEETLRMLQVEIQSHDFFFAFDEAQYGYKLLEKGQLIWFSKSKEPKEYRGVSTPFIRVLTQFLKPVVLAGTAMSLGSNSCKSDLGKGIENCDVFDDFPALNLAEIEKKLEFFLNLEGVTLKDVTNLWKLEGRGRLFGGLFGVLAKVLETRQSNKKAVLERAIDRHYNDFLNGLIERIQDSCPPIDDKIMKKPSVPIGIQQLAICALWGGTVSLPADKFDKDLLHIGLCSIREQDCGGYLYILDEELSRQAILGVAEKEDTVAEQFSRVASLCRPTQGHAMEPLLVAELRAWSGRNKNSTVEEFIKVLFDQDSSSLPAWVRDCFVAGWRHEHSSATITVVAS